MIYVNLFFSVLFLQAECTHTEKMKRYGLGTAVKEIKMSDKTSPHPS